MSTSRTLCLTLLCAAAALAQSHKTIFLITDAEGVAGICRQDQTDPKDPELQQLLTREINAAVDDLHAIVPNAELAVVKEGFSNYACLTLSAQASRDLIRQRAIGAMKALPKIAPYRVDGPVTFQIEYTTRNALGVDISLAPGAEVVDPRTVRYSGKDFREAWTRARK